MKTKLIMLTIVIISLLIIMSFTTAVSSNSDKKIETKITGLYSYRLSKAIDKETNVVKTFNRLKDTKIVFIPILNFVTKRQKLGTTWICTIKSVVNCGESYCFKCKLDKTQISDVFPFFFVDIFKN